MKVDIKVTRDELCVAELTEEELRQMVLTDLITSDVDCDYPEFEVNVFIVG